MSDEKRLIAETPGFALFAVGERHERGWQRFKVEGPEARSRWVKTKWWVNSNGERFARTKESQHLEAHYPDVAQWALKEIAAHMGE